MYVKLWCDILDSSLWLAGSSDVPFLFHTGGRFAFSGDIA